MKTGVPIIMLWSFRPSSNIPGPLKSQKEKEKTISHEFPSNFSRFVKILVWVILYYSFPLL